MNNKEKKAKKLKGFSLIEMLVATLLFVMVTLMVMEIFFSVINTRREVRAVQQDIEDARYSMELMAKTLRMSSVFSGDSSGTGSIYFYDYSQKKCIRYRLGADNKIKVATAGSKNDSTYGFVTDCDNSWSGESDLTNASVDELYFNVKQSSKGTPSKLGHVTMSIKVCYEHDCDTNDSALIQSSVSLRDYGNIKDY